MNPQEKLQAVLDSANHTTSAADTDITAAVRRLIDGYGQGGGGGSSVPAVSKGVNFIDYDGTVVTTWNVDEVASKTALPNNPTHSGLTAQGWNWSLADIQGYISEYPDAVLWVGQMYITDDGKTRIYIHLEEGRLSPYLGICPNGTVDIDWGDGSAHDTLRGTSTSAVVNSQHTYAHGGDYVIALTVTGEMSIAGNSTIGSQLLYNKAGGATGEYSRVYQNAIQKVEMGSGITKLTTYAFDHCYALAAVTIPDSVTDVSTNVFNSCYALDSVTIPASVTSISNYTFANCHSLTSVAIPNGVTRIGSSAFNSCYALDSVTIPASVTSTGNNPFANCHSLANATIPNSVTSIGTQAFYNCYGLGFIKFTSQTPPTVANSNAWTGITDCIIYVPQGTLEAYKAATNYPSPSAHNTYVEY